MIPLSLRDLAHGVYPVTYTTMAGYGDNKTTYYTYHATLHVLPVRTPFVRLDNAEVIATHTQPDGEPDPCLLELSQELATEGHPAFEWPLFTEEATP